MDDKKALTRSVPPGCWSSGGSSGRYIGIIFVCQRCAKAICVPETDEMRKKSEGNLQSYDPPEGWGCGWVSKDIHTGVMCPDCHKALIDFLGGGVKDGD